MPRQITNELGLHPAIYESIKAGWYSGDPRTYFRSVTGLLKPPWMAALEDEHADEISEEAMELLWSLMGAAMHAIVERGADEVGLTEERMCMKIGGELISGGSDLLREVDGRYVVTDFKLTSVWTWVYGRRLEEWERQINLYAMLFRNAGFDVQEGEVCLLFRDWSKTKARVEADYPPQSITHPVEIWPAEQQLAFAEERVRLHKLGMEAGPCTAEERWAKPDTFAVMKKGNKKASKVCDSREEAEAYIGAKKIDASIDCRPGGSIRCEDYCPVAKWCSFRQAEAPAF
jgi:hypothetical protein